MKLHLKQLSTDFQLSLQNERAYVLPIDAGLSIGGSDQGFRPMELLAGALAGCMTIDLIHILKKQRISTEGIAVEIIAVRKDGVPSPFESIRLVYTVAEESLVSKVEKALQLSSEKYCSVSASLAPLIQIDFEVISR